MLQSMYSGIAGMKASSQELNVISNNIANSQTTAFKSSSVTFEDMFNQTLQSSTAPTGNSGGTNASQVGTGTKVESINKDMTAGSSLSTSRALDNSISGNGFFVLSKGATGTGLTVASSGNHEATSVAGVQLDYSRDGSFSLDASGNIVNASGDKLMGYAVTGTPSGTTSIVDSATSGTPPTVSYVDGNGTVVAADTKLVPLVIPDTVMEGGVPVKVSSYSIDQNGVITATLSDKNVTAIGQIALASFTNDTGLEATGNNMYSQSTNSGNAVLNTGINSTSTDVNSGAYGAVMSDTLEQSNVDLATEFTHMIEASRSFEANGKIITTGDTILQTIIGLKQ